MLSHTWHTQATGLRQMAASRSAVVMSSWIASRTSSTHVMMLLGSMGSHSVHAAGSVSPPSRECVRKKSHLRSQSKGFQHVTAGRSTPLTCAPCTSVRG